MKTEQKATNNSNWWLGNYLKMFCFRFVNSPPVVKRGLLENQRFSSMIFHQKASIYIHLWWMLPYFPYFPMIFPWNVDFCGFSSSPSLISGRSPGVSPRPSHITTRISGGSWTTCLGGWGWGQGRIPHVRSMRFYCGKAKRSTRKKTKDRWKAWKFQIPARAGASGTWADAGHEEQYSLGSWIIFFPRKRTNM